MPEEKLAMALGSTSELAKAREPSLVLIRKKGGMVQIEHT